VVRQHRSYLVDESVDGSRGVRRVIDDVDEGTEARGGGVIVRDARQEELRVIVGGPALEDAPGEDLRESVGEALMRTLEDREGAGLGVHVKGHVGEVDCSVACDLLGLGPGADDRLGGFAGRGRDVAGLSLIQPCVFPFEDAFY